MENLHRKHSLSFPKENLLRKHSLSFAYTEQTS
jgi:hypothetical protein